MKSTEATKRAALAARQDVGSLQMLLVAFLEDKNWIRLRRALCISFFLDAARALHKNPSLFGANLLHVALRCSPPTNIVELILQRLPETPFLPDCIGRYPLHIASSFGIPSNIVDAVAKAYPQACLKRDLDGRTPLHFACDSARVLYEEDPNTCHPPDKGMLCIDTIRCLVSHEPSAVHVEDIDECNAIELALLSNADEEVIFLLQKVSVLEHRAEKRGRSTKEGCPTPIKETESTAQAVKCWSTAKRKND